MMAARRARSALCSALVVILAIGAGPGLARLAASASTLPTAAAPEDARRLDELFARLLATTDESEGDVIVAEIWQLWAASGDDDTNLLLRQAVLLLQQGRLAGALDVLDGLVRRAPDFAEAWNKRATVLYLTGEHDRSLADIEKVLALEPRHFGALSGRGLIHAAAARWKEALAAYRQALAINPFLKERHEVVPMLERKAEGERI